MYRLLLYQLRLFVEKDGHVSGPDKFVSSIHGMSAPEKHHLKTKSAVQSTRKCAMGGTSRTPDHRSPRLPPIVNEGASTSRDQGYHLLHPRQPPWSRYHEGCVEKSPMYLNWFAIKMRSSGSSKGRNVPVFKNEDQLITYLDNNRDFLEAYVIERVPSRELKRWQLQKLRPAKTQRTTVKPNKRLIFMHADFTPTTTILDKNDKTFFSRLRLNSHGANHDLFNALQQDPSQEQLILAFARSLTNLVGVDAYRIFKLTAGNIVHYFYEDHSKALHDSRIQTGLVKSEANEVLLVLEVVRRGSPLRLSRLEDGNRFPNTPHYLFKSSKMKSIKDGNHVMYQPVLVSNGEIGFVIEMWRINEKFKVVDEESSSSFMVWGSLALHYCCLYIQKTKERNMADFLLHVVNAIFEELVSLGQLIKTILEFAQHLVNADRASLFLLDDKKNELVSTVFDLKYEPSQDNDTEKTEIRMPVNSGIAGYVAITGETLNIPDAYADYRFNREVDAATGYRTKSILCMPIKVEGEVIGVVQMVNKRNQEIFDRDDEASFEIFATFFGLALKHARLYDRIKRNEQKYKVALEVLSYHNTCRENEVKALLYNNGSEYIDIYFLSDFYLDPYKLDEYEKCKSVLVMIDDLFGNETFEKETLSRFVLTVKKNYRNVPYHNFDHGWSVANSMYNILKTDHKQRFDYKTRLALFIACLCHDLDHRGYTNKYMSETASPLAAMYTTSTLEHHHFNITVTILQQDGHNIFSHMSSEAYKSILGKIRQAILATDLAAFFPNLEKMNKLHDEESNVKFDWGVPGHSDLAMAISMTAADLSAAAKPWDVQIKTVKVIFEEFYDQGDKEYAVGRTPIPMMDRNKRDQQPNSQVGFLSQICIPCYTMLNKILPNTQPMYTMASRNLIRWVARAESVIEDSSELDEPNDSDERNDLNEPNEANENNDACENNDANEKNVVNENNEPESRHDEDRPAKSNVNGIYVILDEIKMNDHLKVNTEHSSSSTLHGPKPESGEDNARVIEPEINSDNAINETIDESDDNEVVTKTKPSKDPTIE